MEKKNYEQVLQTICNLLKDKNLQQKDLCEALNLKNKSFTEWKAGRSTSYMKKLPEIATYFGVSVDYLLGYEKDAVAETSEEKEKTPEEQMLTEGEKMLLQLFRQVPEEKQPHLIQLIKVALGMQK